jgi:hypothetical protein
MVRSLNNWPQHSLIDIAYDRTFQVLASKLPMPSLVPAIQYNISDYLSFDLNWAAVHAGLYFVYYLILEPAAAVRFPSFPGPPSYFTDPI